MTGSEKEGTVAELWLAPPAIRLLNPLGGGAVRIPECLLFFFHDHWWAARPMDTPLKNTAARAATWWR
jgi:hypothetical protein